MTDLSVLLPQAGQGFLHFQTSPGTNDFSRDQDRSPGHTPGTTEEGSQPSGTSHSTALERRSSFSQ